jgi:hypothetical protein
MIVGPSIAAEEDVRLEEGRWIRGILPESSTSVTA